MFKFFTTLLNLQRAKSKAIVESGPIFLSTAECEISLSCHNATFSNAGTTLDLINLARPVKFSLKIGFFYEALPKNLFAFFQKILLLLKLLFFEGV